MRRVIRYIHGRKGYSILLLSGFIALGWCGFLLYLPHTLDQTTYAAFGWYSSDYWVGFFGLVGFLHIIAFVTKREWVVILAYALGAGLWTFVGVNFFYAPHANTGIISYGALGVACFLGAIDEVLLNEGDR